MALIVRRRSPDLGPTISSTSTLTTRKTDARFAQGLSGVLFPPAKRARQVRVYAPKWWLFIGDTGIRPGRAGAFVVVAVLLSAFADVRPVSMRAVSANVVSKCRCSHAALVKARSALTCCIIAHFSRLCSNRFLHSICAILWPGLTVLVFNRELSSRVAKN